MNDKEFNKGIDRTQSKLRRFAANVNRIGRSLTIGGGAITGAFIPFIRVVANAETAMRRFDLIFGAAAESMRTQLKAISRETSVPMTTLIEQSSSFAAIFGDLKDAIGEAGFTQIVGTVQRQILNLSALAGISIAEAADRIRSAFTSTGEAVDQYGLNLRQAEVNAEAQRLGLSKTVRQMTELEKQLVKLSIIQNKFRNINVDFVMMVDTLNGQFTLLVANLKELAVVAGGQMKAALLPVLQGMNKALVNLKPAAKAVQPLIVWLGTGATSMLALGLSLQGFAISLRVLAWTLKPFLVSMKWLAGGGLAVVFANISKGIGLMAFSIQTLTASLMALKLTLAGVSMFMAANTFQRTGLNEKMTAMGQDAERKILGPKLWKATQRDRARTSEDASETIPGVAAASGVEARGTFAGTSLANQLAFGTSTAQEKTAVATTALLQIANQVLGKGPGGGSAVKVQGAAG